jgi:hypothetical protein
MAVLAGTIRATATGNPLWEACDGKAYYVAMRKDPQSGVTVLPRAATAPGWGDLRDYPRRVGRKYGWCGFGPNGWRFNVPRQPGNFIKLNDDSADT